MAASSMRRTDRACRSVTQTTSLLSSSLPRGDRRALISTARNCRYRAGRRLPQNNDCGAPRRTFYSQLRCGPRTTGGAQIAKYTGDPNGVRTLKGPKTPMHGRLQENRRDCGASDVRGGVIDPEEPFMRMAKFLPI